MIDRPPRAPAPRAATARATIRDTLLAARDAGATANAHNLSVAAGISEKEVVAHLEHLARSLPHDALKLDVVPAECLACAYIFRDRDRLTTPSACPTCRSERVSPPSFRIVDGKRIAKRERARNDDE